MNALLEAYESAAQAVTSDPHSPRAAESVALMIAEIDEFLASPVMVVAAEVGPERFDVVREQLVDAARRVFDGLHAMMCVGLLGVPRGPWVRDLQDAMRRFQVACERHFGITLEPPEESPDEVLEDAMDLVRAQHTEAMARVRTEPLLDWETIRRELDLDRD